MRCHVVKNAAQEKSPSARKACSKAEYVPIVRVRCSFKAAEQRMRSLGQQGSGAPELEWGQTSVITVPSGKGSARL